MLSYYSFKRRETVSIHFNISNQNNHVPVSNLTNIWDAYFSLKFLFTSNSFGSFCFLLPYLHYAELFYVLGTTRVRRKLSNGNKIPVQSYNSWFNEKCIIQKD